jgi:RNA polymerase sigma factor (sigma-70 family)
MTALAPTAYEESPDADLWQLVRQGSVPAFETLVRRHQSAVCAVAYNACGDLSRSEDVAQETFWAAWQGRQRLDDPNRLRAWLCGIARNLGKNARRRAAREAGSLEAAAELSAAVPDPAAAAVAREEESLVWQTIAEIPESYREPLILFYREEQSVAEVAATLDLSEDAVKQRLSRGRGMLRDRVAELVEGTLRRSRPGQAFTVAVLTGLTTASVGAKSALAGTGAVAAGPAVKAAAGAGLTGGVVGGILGPLVGLAGGWFGTWLPAQLAPSREERDLLTRTGRRMLLVSVLFTVALVAPVLVFAGRFALIPYLFFWLAWMLAFTTYVTVESVLGSRAVRRIRAGGVTEPNDSPLRAGVAGQLSRVRGRVYRSRATFLGLPLVDINVRDPQLPGTSDLAAGRGIARGWLAIGDDARGVLLAVGGVARGFIAIGGRALGVLSFGGVAFGLVTVGGVAIGGLAIGGLAVGVLGLGGLGIGWQAGGGGAVARDTAVGGAAVAWRAAYGGAAFAHDYAIGGTARALHANDDAAKEVLLNHPLKRGVDWYAGHTTLVTIVLVAPGVLLPGVMMPLMYRREQAP